MALRQGLADPVGFSTTPKAPYFANVATGDGLAWLVRRTARMAHTRNSEIVTKPNPVIIRRYNQEEVILVPPAEWRRLQDLEREYSEDE